ncbi:MAG: tryptophan-rich sensory protein [Clostridia bacterium]|nr:tryptophan-rich sensory protein [Clostridia bacterium]
MKKFFTFLLSIAASVGTGFLSGYLTRGATAIYNAQAIKPPLNPPALVFPIVWAILYTLMGISLALVLTSPKATRDAKFVSTAFFILNLCFCFLWPVWFFIFGLYWFAFVWLLLLLGTAILMTLVFSVTSKWAAILQIPYIVWLLFAGYLNVAVAILN